jgi:23S rRNA pseudouridine1911/1915/1917 synthase
MKIEVEKTNIGRRIDAILSEIYKEKGLSRSIIQEYIKEGCSVNGKQCKKSYKLKEGDILDIDEKYWERIVDTLDLSNDIVAQQGELDIRYEDGDMLVLYKPKGLVVHPGVGNRDNTLANYLRYYLQQKGEYDNLVDRAGIVHRLDKGVSGLMVVAKNKNTQEYLKSQFKNHQVIKIYRAELEESKNIERNVDIEKYIEEMNIQFEPWKRWEKVEGYIGRSPKDRYKMEFKRYQFKGSKYALTYFFFVDNQALIKIDTGRMHQIRATLEYLGYHIKGDKLYGKGTDNKIMLEAIILSFLNKEGKRVTFKV